MADFINEEILADVRVPGNILLAGEYAVTRPLGKGFSIAVNTYVKGRLAKGSGKALGYTGGTVFDIDARLIEAVIEASARHGINIQKTSSEIDIFIDSSDFYNSSGRKLGLGSSAAAILCIVTLYAVYTVSYADPLDLAAIAYEAHNIFQGQRGSGYDVYTSVMGGCNLFTGSGSPAGLPRIEQIPLGFLKNFYLLSGPEAVKTVRSVQAFEAWRSDHDEQWRSMYNENQSIVETLAASENIHGFVDVLAMAGEWGRKLGNLIGVSADVPFTESIIRGLPENCVFKSAGAGNELAVVIDPDDSLLHTDKLTDGLRFCKLDRGGLIWRA